MSPRRTRRGRKSSSQTPSLVPVAVLPVTVNWVSTVGGSKSYQGNVTSDTGATYRISSLDVMAAAPAPTTFQIVGYADGVEQFATQTMVLGPTPRRIRMKAPRNLLYGAPEDAYWNLILSGAGTVAGKAIFTTKETLGS